MIKIKTNDTVKILYGKDSGKQGKVSKVWVKEEKVLVDGLNLFKKHIKGDGKTKQSEIATISKPLHIAKVMLICPSCKKSTRVAIERKGKIKTRICKKCSKSIDEFVEVEKEKKVEKKETKSKTKKVNKKK